MILAKEMYPDDELLGWYINGVHTVVLDSEQHLNHQFMKYNDRPLVLKFDTERLQSTGRVCLSACFMIFYFHF